MCKRSGPGCSKLTTSLVNVSLKFQLLISHMQKLSKFFQQKISVYSVINCKTLNELTS